MSELKLQQCRLDGRYDVLDCLGRGSYSEVYVAQDAAASNGSPSTVVIKALNTHLQGGADPDLERTLIENFRNEAVALDRVRHPNIISRLGHGTAIDLKGRTFHYLVLEYLPGGDLQTLCLRQPLALDRALYYLEQLCTGLAYAHLHGVIHRDIKPHNLLLTADLTVIKIADFGVAKIGAGDGAITRVGTDVYAAPEHHPLAQTGPLDTAALNRPAVHLTPAADVYSLAKTAYMLLTGDAPRRFSQRPITELPSAADKEWAAFVLRVLRRATDTNPAARFQTVQEFWEEIKDATMPRTQTLTRDTLDAADANPHFRTTESDARDTSTAAPAPAVSIAPPFFNNVPAQPHPRTEGPPARPRIVVPVISTRPQVNHPSGQFPVVGMHTTAAAAIESQSHIHAGQNVGQYAGSQPGREQLSSRARRWIVGLLILLMFAGMLYAIHSYIRRPQASSATTVNTTNPPASAVGREFVATTDVNLRQGPARNAARVGMAEAGSRVRVL
ncbi:MAG: serine/threonine protein kinase, partial [Acidobacteriota bacterium]|nr:serine/threonine protein kinase [Acidobacteriota bacterium]